MIPGIMLGLMIGLAAGSFATFLIVLKIVAKGEERVILKLGAYVCSACPLCIFHRSKPGSDLGEGIRIMKKACPFCLSFDRLRSLDKAEEKKAAIRPEGN